MRNAKVASARLWLCTVLLCVALAGCGVGRPGVPINFDDPLDVRLEDLAKSAQSASLSDLTDFSWDEVHFFPPSEGEERVEEVVGVPVRVNGSVSGGGLLVFEENGTVVKAVGISRSLGAGRTTWPSEVLLEPWGNGALRLTLPAPRPAP